MYLAEMWMWVPRTEALNRFQKLSTELVWKVSPSGSHSGCST
jgi:hypothetical protein